MHSGDEMPYVPRHQANASLDVETRLTGGYVALTYVSRMREVAGAGPLDQTLATDEQLTVDAGAKYELLTSLELRLDVRNVFDSHAIVSRRPFGARPNAPRWVQVGAKWSY